MSKYPIKCSATGDRASTSGRTVEITDEDESIVIAFVPVGPKTALPTELNQPEKGKLP